MTRPDTPGGADPRRPSSGRVVIWIVVSAIGVYFVVSGIIGMLTPG